MGFSSESSDSPSSSSSSPVALDWKLSHVFDHALPIGDDGDFDAITAIEFDKNGDHLAVGDRCGRVVIFQDTGGKDDLVQSTPRNELERLDTALLKHPKYQYKTEFQSHEPEFDYFNSSEIEEKINKVRWCAASTGSLHILSSNDKSIKLWKVRDYQVKRAVQIDTSQPISSENSFLDENSSINEQKSYFGNVHALEWTQNMGNGVSSHSGVHNKITGLEDATVSRCRRVYDGAHDFKINSISINSDWETFLSGDGLRINLWNLEVSNQCFNIIDMKPVNMEDLKELITAVEFHPFHCNMLAYSSTKGFVRLVDMRKSALCDHSAIILKDEEFHGHFTQIISSITDMKFANDGRHILSRDLMNLKLWDMHMNSGPVATVRIHENLRPKLADMYSNNAIFDKFECCLAKDNLNFATGSYSNIVHVFSHGSGTDGVTFEVGRDPNSCSYDNGGFYRQDGRSTESNEFSYDYDSKLKHLAWHPTTNLIACAAGSSLFMYHA